MSILIPFNDENATDSYIEAGASEFYLGFYDDEWEARFGETVELNRMSGFKREANAYPLDEFLPLVTRTIAKGVHLYVPFNASSYTDEQYDWIVSRYLKLIAEAGATGVILSTPELIAPAKELGLVTVASTMCGIFNADIARFYQRAGIDRMIFPRELSIDEIRTIKEAVPGLAYEVFLMRNGCIFSDSHCLGRHRAGCFSVCRTLRQAEYFTDLHDPQHSPSQIAENDRAYREDLFDRACGLCALWYFEQMGIDAYKVVGRGDDPRALAHDIALIDRNLKIARDCASQAEFLERMERPEGFEDVCANRLSCYYPEALNA